MSSSQIDQELETLIRARYPIIYIVSWEEKRVEDALRAIAQARGKKVYFWSITQGLVLNPNRQDSATRDPIAALNAVMDSQDQALFVLKDYHAFISDVTVTRRLRDLTTALKTSYKTLIILAPTLKLPMELEKDITVVDYGLPDRDDLDQLLEGIIQSVKDNPQIDTTLTELERDQILKAAQGLTANEAENVFAKSLVEKHKFDVDVILGEKEQIIRKSGILEYYPFIEGIEDVGGLDLLKDWMDKRTIAFTEKARDFGLPAPRGVLLLGVQGCGKSLSAKAIGSLWRLPLLRLDVGRIFGGIVGQSEENMRKAIRVAESVAPCVAGDTRILLADGSERAIQELYEGEEPRLQVMGMNAEWQLVPVEVRAVTRREAPDLYTVRLKHGQLRATSNHLHPVLRDGELVWVRTDALTTRDHVAMPRAIPQPTEMPRLLKFLPSAIPINTRALPRSPQTLNEDIGYLLGLIASDGFLSQRRIGFVNTDRDLHCLFAELLEKNFGFAAKIRLMECRGAQTPLVGITEQSVFRPCYTSYVDSALLRQTFHNIQAHLLQMPAVFLNAWIRGYFDGDGYIADSEAKDPKIALTSKRPEQNRFIRSVLQRIGFLASNPGNANIEITGIQNVRRFIAQIGSNHSCKKERMEAWLRKPLPEQPKDRTDAIPIGAKLRRVRQSIGMGSQHFASAFPSLMHRYEHGQGHPNRERLQAILQEMKAWAEQRGQDSTEITDIQKLADSPILWSQVASVEQETPPRYVYDLVCDAPHNFVSNGILTHNCILWLDELEKGFSGTQSSGMSDGGTTARVFGTFLTWMQDKRAAAFVVATSNDVTALPPELLRKGRFDEIFFIDLPAYEERQQIFRIHLGKRKRNPEEFNIAALAEATPGFSGAEIAAAVEEALYNAFDENAELTTQSIVGAAQTTVPLSMTMRERIEDLREWAATRARPASSAKAEDMDTITEQLLVAKATDPETNEMDPAKLDIRSVVPKPPPPLAGP